MPSFICLNCKNQMTQILDKDNPNSEALPYHLKCPYCNRELVLMNQGDPTKHDANTAKKKIADTLKNVGGRMNNVEKTMMG